MQWPVGWLGSTLRHVGTCSCCSSLRRPGQHVAVVGGHVALTCGPLVLAHAADKHAAVPVPGPRQPGEHSGGVEGAASARGDHAGHGEDLVIEAGGEGVHLLGHVPLEVVAADQALLLVPHDDVQQRVAEGCQEEPGLGPASGHHVVTMVTGDETLELVWAQGEVSTLFAADID